MARTSRDQEPTDGFLEQEFARFREERLKARAQKVAPAHEPAVGGSTAAVAPASPAVEHLDGADDDFARFRAARLRDGGRPSGRHRLPKSNGPLEPVRSTRTLTAIEAPADPVRATGPRTAVEAAAPAPEPVERVPAVVIEPHAKATISPIEETARVAAAEPAPAPAPAPAAPAVDESQDGSGFDRFRAQRAQNRQVEATPPAQAPDDGLFFGTSSHERRSMGARVKDSRTDTSPTDIVAALVVLDEAAAAPSTTLVGPGEKTPPHGREKTPPHGREKTPPHGREKTPPHGSGAGPTGPA